MIIIVDNYVADQGSNLELNSYTVTASYHLMSPPLRIQFPAAVYHVMNRVPRDNRRLPATGTIKPSSTR